MSSISQQHLAALTSFLSSYDAKDKFTGVIQYGAMFLADGEPGINKNIYTKVASARKVFRLLNETKPAKALLGKPGIGDGPMALELLEKVKMVSYATYFLGGHIQLLGDIGIVNDKELCANAGKASYWGWAISSICAALMDTYQIANLAVARREGEDDETWAARKAAARTNLYKRLLNIANSSATAVLALGMLGKIPMKNRSLAALGVTTSLVTCYTMYPALPSSKAKTS
eukprot:CAMPEP_0117677264 /NCGR_PEP_ID=MMETSP0804-20121206/16652_1 /TAXON_ID=1074897 /ORGANISM="Tetraselmis astigmatica, Strain CCMP880" /LENGTH=229 /DNA_ID=CAMNT_0005486535 /DNA_START=90 /DNA_END=779 /DNA_ORIENTATION=-